MWVVIIKPEDTVEARKEESQESGGGNTNLIITWKERTYNQFISPQEQCVNHFKIQDINLWEKQIQ